MVKGVFMEIVRLLHTIRVNKYTYTFAFVIEYTSSAYIHFKFACLMTFDL